MKHNIIKDISILTDTPITQLENRLDKISKIVCHNVLEDSLNNDNTTEIDTVFGSIFINVIDNSISYKFVPTKQFESMILNTLTTKDSPVNDRLETIITERIVSTYKDLF